MDLFKISLCVLRSFNLTHVERYAIYGGTFRGAKRVEISEF